MGYRGPVVCACSLCLPSLLYRIVVKLRERDYVSHHELLAGKVECTGVKLA